ncbi:MAG: hypothetical protein LIO46_02570 [Clostridiales bacterium]|nr:hypothetical protein [Clostridiales bacterium]
MNGLDKINQSILDDARTEAQQVLREGRQASDAVLSEARKECEAIRSRARQEAEKAHALSVEKMESAARLKQQQVRLACRTREIDRILEDALAQMQNAGPEPYRDMMLRLLEQYVQPDGGVLCLAEGDDSRLGAGFAEQAQKLAAQHGGKLELRTGGAWQGGFLLIYGDIEIDCTFAALLDARREALRDLVNQILF